MKAKPITFADRLHELLNESKIVDNSNQLAKATGITRQAISRILLNERQPTFGNVVRICRALGVSLSAFDCVTVIAPVPKKKE